MLSQFHNSFTSASLCQEEPDQYLATSQREGGGLCLSAPIREKGSFGSCETNHVVASGRWVVVGGRHDCDSASRFFLCRLVRRANSYTKRRRQFSAGAVSPPHRPATPQTSSPSLHHHIDARSHEVCAHMYHLLYLIELYFAPFPPPALVNSFCHRCVIRYDERPL